MQKQINVPIKLLELKDLSILCKENGLKIYSLMKYWKNNAVGRNLNMGELNPRFGQEMSTHTKQLIGTKCKERNLDLEYRNKIRKGILKYYEDGGKAVGPPKKRKMVVCANCEKEFEVIQSSTIKYCSKSCGLIKTTELANISTRERFDTLHNNLKIALFERFKNEKDLLNSKQRNKIYPVVREVFRIYSIKDIRVFKFLFLHSYLGSFENLYNAFNLEFNNYLKYMPNLQDDKL